MVRKMNKFVAQLLYQYLTFKLSLITFSNNSNKSIHIVTKIHHRLNSKVSI
jgi:hypothetical protein